MRYDQFMRIGWKVLIPVSLVWIVCAAGIRVSRQQHLDTKPLLIGVVALLIVLLAASMFFPAKPDAGDGRDEPRGNDGETPPQDTALPGAPMVAFSRVVTDHATFAWLCDVFVDESARGRGVGTWMTQVLVDLLTAEGVQRMILGTRDAHEIYARAGFEPMQGTWRYMEIDRRPVRDAVLAAGPPEERPRDESLVPDGE